MGGKLKAHKKPNEANIQKLKESAQLIVNKVKKFIYEEEQSTLIYGAWMRHIRMVQHTFMKLIEKHPNVAIEQNIIQYQWKNFIYPISSVYKKALLELHKVLEESRETMTLMLEQHPEEQKTNKEGQLLTHTLQEHLSIKEWRENLKGDEKKLAQHIQEFEEFCMDQVKRYRKCCYTKNKKQRKKNAKDESKISMRVELELFMGDLCRYAAMVNVLDDKRYKKCYRFGMNHYIKATQLDPHSGFAFNQVALIHTRLKNRFEAIFYYTRALASKNRYRSALKNIAKPFDQDVVHEEGSLSQIFLKWYIAIVGELCLDRRYYGMIDQLTNKTMDDMSSQKVSLNEADAGKYVIMLEFMVWQASLQPSSNLMMKAILRMVCQFGHFLCANEFIESVCALLVLFAQPKYFFFLNKHVEAISKDYGTFLRSLVNLSNTLFGKFHKQLPTTLQFFRQDEFFLGLTPIQDLYQYHHRGLPNKHHSPNVVYQKRLLSLMDTFALLPNAHVRLCDSYYEVSPRLHSIVFQHNMQESMQKVLLIAQKNKPRLTKKPLISSDSDSDEEDDDEDGYLSDSDDENIDDDHEYNQVDDIDQENQNDHDNHHNDKVELDSININPNDHSSMLSMTSPDLLPLEDYGNTSLFYDDLPQNNYAPHYNRNIKYTQVVDDIDIEEDFLSLISQPKSMKKSKSSNSTSTPTIPPSSSSSSSSSTSSTSNVIFPQQSSNFSIFNHDVHNFQPFQFPSNELYRPYSSSFSSPLQDTVFKETPSSSTKDHLARNAAQAADDAANSPH